MRKFINIILIVLAVFSLSANKSIEDATNQNVVGTWEAVKLEITKCNEAGILDFRCPELCMTLFFNDNGSAEKILTDNVAAGSRFKYDVTFSENAMSFCNALDSNIPCYSATFVLIDNTLIITTNEVDGGCEEVTTYIRK